MADRTVAITGAGSGIGRAIARAFAEQGDLVLLRRRLGSAAWPRARPSWIRSARSTLTWST